MPTGYSKNPKQKKCVVCNTKFLATQVSRKFCSKKCRLRFHNQKSAERQKQWGRDGQGRFAEGKIQCQICGRWYVQICSHAWYRHKIDNREYKQLTGRDVKKGLIPDWYRAIKRKHNLDTKEVVWVNLKKGEKYWFKKGESKNYERSPETLDRLRKQIRAMHEK